MEERIDWTVIARLRRELKGWSQAEFARQAGLSKAAICLIEQEGRSQPYAGTVAKLATALGITVDELYVYAGYKSVLWSVAEMPDEVHLLRLFRALDDTGQAMALEMIGSLVQVRRQS